MTTRPSIARRWPGATIACLATGPSLTVEDCDFVRGKAPVIAINDAHRLAPWAEILYSSDRAWWPYHKGVPTFAGTKIGVGSGLGKANSFGRHQDITVLRNTGYHGLETDPGGLRTGRNSGYAAINLAVHLGAARILLLGYNMGFQCGRAHFFGDHPPQLLQRESLYASFRRSFEHLVTPLQELGIEVINCTPDTSLSTFPVRELRQVLTAPLAVAS